MAWMKTIDSGKNDEVTDVIQTTDGGYAIAGGYSSPSCNRAGHIPTTPTIIRLSRDGEIVWEREYLSVITSKSTFQNTIKGLVQTSDNGFYIIPENGMVVRINSRGLTLWDRVRDPNMLNKTGVESVCRTDDGGSVISGFTFQCTLSQGGHEQCPRDDREVTAFIEKLDRDGNLSWFRRYDDRGFFRASHIVALDDDKGYVGIMKNASDYSYVILDANGEYIKSVPLDSVYSRSYLQSLPGGFAGFSVNQSMNRTMETFVHNEAGDLRRIVHLENLTAYDLSDYSGATIVTHDGEFFSIRRKGSYYSNPITTIVHALKFDSSGKQLWDHEITNFSVAKDNVEFRKLIETADGGYLLVLGVEKWRSC